MILRIGRAHKHEPQIYNFCRQFSLNNEELLLLSMGDAIRNSSKNDDWSLANGLAYFLTPDNHERIVRALRGEFPTRFDDYFFTVLQGEVGRRDRASQSRPRRRPNRATSEEVSLAPELISRLRGFKTKKDLRVVVELSQLVEEFARTNKVLSHTQRAEVLTFISDNVFGRFDPSAGRISLNKDVSHRSWKISSFLGVFGLGVQIFYHLNEGNEAFRDKLIEYLPFASQDEKLWIRDQIGALTKSESDKLCRMFITNEALKVIKLENLLEISKQLYPESVQELFPTLILDSTVDSYEKRRLISAMVEGGTSDTVLREMKRNLSTDQEIVEHIDNFLIERFGCKRTAQERASALILGAGVVPRRRSGAAYSPGALESEMWEKRFAAPLLRVSDPSWSDIYSELLDAGFKLAARGEELVTYADYLWDVVFKYTENLIVHRSYQPFIDLEREIAKHFDSDGSNWIQGKLVKLRNSYAMILGKPTSFIAATLKYNSCLDALVSPIENSRELLQVVSDALRNEVAHWFVGAGRKLVDGAYNVNSKQREVSIQRLMKGPLLEALNHKRHIDYSFVVIREPQLDDDRRTDLLISYGFIGPCVVELKLSSHKDLNAGPLNGTKSFANLQSYMNGYRCNAGILVVLEDKKLNPSKRKLIAEAFAEIAGLITLFLDLPEKPVRAPKQKRNTKAQTKQPQRAGSTGRPPAKEC